MIVWHNRIGFRIFLAILFTNVMLSLGISLGMYLILKNQYFTQFRESNLALARTLAGAVDPRQHATFRSLEAVKDPGYQRLLQYFRSIKEKHPYIVYLYSAHFDPQTETLSYAVDATPVESDTIWAESSDFSFYLNQVGQRSLNLVYNERDFAQSFRSQSGVMVEFDPASRRLLFAGQPLLEIVQEEPLSVRFLWPGPESAGKRLDAGARELSFSIDGVEWSFSFSSRGGPGSDPGSEYVDDAASLELLRENLRQGKDHVDEGIRSSSYGDFVSAQAMIRDGEKVVGFLSLDISAASVAEFNRSLLFLSLGVFLAALGFSVLLALLLTRYINRPIQALSGAVHKMGEGDLSIRVQWDSPDEFGQLARNMTAMAGSLEAARSHILKINEASRKFVPQDFLHFLRRDDLTQIKLGDQVEQKLSILFSDIRSFTSISEAMTPEENFKFINDYLKLMGPEIRGHSGFIDKYIGDAIMALFPRDANDAVLSAISMHERLHQYNQGWDVERFGLLKIGVGIHTGNMMLGIVGEEMRMDSTVISDAVNVAARLESLTKSYHCRILISSVTYEQLRPDLQSLSRYMGPLKIRGKTTSVELYEVFAADSPSTRGQKEASRTEFEAATRKLAVGKKAEAARALSDLRGRYPADQTLTVLLAECE